MLDTSGVSCHQKNYVLELPSCRSKKSSKVILRWNEIILQKGLHDMTDWNSSKDFIIKEDTSNASLLFLCRSTFTLWISWTFSFLIANRMRTIQCLNNSESSHKQSKAFPHKITKKNSSNQHSPPLGYWIAMEFVPLIMYFKCSPSVTCKLAINCNSLASLRCSAKSLQLCKCAPYCGLQPQPSSI